MDVGCKKGYFYRRDNYRHIGNMQESNVKNCKIVYTTVSKLQEAEALAKSAVEKCLAFCVSITPGILSVYSWKDKLEKSPECAIMFKTTPELLPGLMRFLGENHPYIRPSVMVWKAEHSQLDRENSQCIPPV